tara:strand:- start:98 stop:580 length:483 start_codon:yes stop_codon:yes gene_type:complete
MSVAPDTSSRLRLKANTGIGVGFVLQCIYIISPVEGNTDVEDLILLLTTLPIFIWGCMNYAKLKGHSKWVGLVGFAGTIGLIVLFVLPDLAKGEKNSSVYKKLISCFFVLIGFAIAAYGLALDEEPIYDYSSLPRIFMGIGFCVAVGAIFFAILHQRKRK